MPAHRLVSEAQERALVRAMRDNPDIAKGRVSGGAGLLAKVSVSQFWNRLASELNANGSGAVRTSQKWKDYWTEKKFRVRKKAAALRVHARETGGEPPKKARLTDVEEEILRIIGNVKVHSEPSVCIPFDDPSTSQSEPTPKQELQPAEALPVPKVALLAKVEELLTAARQPRAAQHQPIDGDAVVKEQLPNADGAPQPQADQQQPNEERINIGVPQWALNLEHRRLEIEQERAAAASRMAESIARVATAVEAQQNCFLAAERERAAATNHMAEIMDRMTQAVESQNRLISLLLEGAQK